MTLRRGLKITTWDQVKKIRAEHPPEDVHQATCTCAVCAVQSLLLYIEQVQPDPPVPLERRAEHDIGKHVLYVPERERGIIMGASSDPALVFVLYEGGTHSKATKWNDLIPWRGEVIGAE